MCKIVGFTNKIDGYKTTAGKKTLPVFIDACDKTALILDKNFNKLCTTRQASKFFKQRGIVYQTAILNN